MTTLRAKVATMHERLARCLTAFRRDRAGVSALEFAFVLPLMLTIYIGSFEISQGLSAKTKVSQTARTITDLVSRTGLVQSGPPSTSVITTAQLTDIFNATNTIMSPFTITNAQFVLVVSIINVDQYGNATIAPSGGSCASDGNTYYTPGQSVTIPAGLVPLGSPGYLIWGTASYTYSPFLVRGGAPFYTMVGPVTLADQMYMSPRNSQTVTLPTPC
jgi:Flp pilus assembly protein TadG